MAGLQQKRSAVIWLAIGLAVGATVPALAQTTLMAMGSFKGSFGSLEWHSGCSKPYFPSLSMADQFSIESTKTDFSVYQECLRRHAAADSAYAAQAVGEAARKELRDVEEDARASGWSIN